MSHLLRDALAAGLEKLGAPDPRRPHITLVNSVGPVPMPLAAREGWQGDRGFNLLLDAGPGHSTYFGKCRDASDVAFARETVMIERLSASPAGRDLLPAACGVQVGRLRLQLSVYRKGTPLNRLIRGYSTQEWEDALRRVISAADSLSLGATDALLGVVPAPAALGVAAEAAPTFATLAGAGVPPDIIEAFQRALDPAMVVQSRLQHGDLWASNVLRTDTGWVLLDLEFFGVVQVPLYDAAHMVKTTSQMRTTPAEPWDAPPTPWSRLLLEDGPEARVGRRVLADAAAANGLSTDAAVACMLFYLCDATARLVTQSTPAALLEPALQDLARFGEALKDGVAAKTLLGFDGAAAHAGRFVASGPTVAGPRDRTLSISVIVPCYNAAKYITTALDSVVAQGRPPLEIICVDDGSTDGTPELVQRYPVRLLRTDRNSGPAAARNAAAAAAKGDVLAFLDAVDVWEATHLETVIGLLERHDGVEVAASRWQTFGIVNAVSEAWVADGQPVNVLQPLLMRNRLAQSATAVRRAAFMEVGGYRQDMRFGEDYDLWLRLAARGPFVLSHALTMRYRIHSQQVTSSVGAAFGGSWTARAAARGSPAIAELPPRQLAAIDASLRASWARDLAVAWHKRDSEPVHEVLALHRLVPGSTRLHMWWRFKILMGRPVWGVAAAAWDRLPDAPKRIVRGLRSRDAPPWQP